MFTGIIQATGKVERSSEKSGIRRVAIRRPAGWRLSLGQSISVDGICSTVVARAVKHFEVEYMPETLRKTTAGSFDRGTLLNLERSLGLKDFVDGHLVQGHVDGKGVVTKIEDEGASRLISVKVPADLKRFIAARGSIAVNGVSLTVARVRGTTFTVALIPHTLKATNLGLLTKGSEVNIETDLVARYLVR